ncbi:eukaryotic translation initiation factor 2-alpha kinase-like isoform X1 [Leptotrombidium deliense]|uniref:non-specific serine/threonine protein kinase n=1 Tax=Leptotrombidium deliense TaxID=299467 RepID=A0A443SHJ7_9ACAR|nr:eukaryotic translation initiation factor 2-alpha kinase-like isoform X1 [Leptotrombidium deliense]
MHFGSFQRLILTLFSFWCFFELCRSQQANPLAPLESNILVSTLEGSLFAIGKQTGIIKWSLREQPIVHLPLMPGPGSKVDIPLFLPDPKDGSLYRYNVANDATNKRDVLEKLPFTLSELISLSPCRSKDGLLYIGKKVDSFFAVDRETGQKVLLEGDKNVFTQSSNSNIASDDKLLLITKAEYQLSVYDLKSKHKIWNLTVIDYANTANVVVDQNHYDVGLVSSSKSGHLVAVDPITRDVLWTQSLGSSVISVFEYSGNTPFGHMLQVPFVTISEDNVLYPGLKSFYNLHPSLYIGSIGSKFSYALTAMVDEDLTPIVSIKLPLIDGPKLENENESDDVINPGSHPVHPFMIHTGFYEYPGYSKIEFSPLVSVNTINFGGEDELDSSFLSSIIKENQNAKETSKPEQCANVKNYSELMNSISNKDSELCDDSESEYPQIVIVSLWHWWREVLAISVTFAVLLNILLSYLRRKCAKITDDCVAKCSSITEGNVEEKVSQQTVNSNQTEISTISSSTSRQSSTDISTVSRFDTDFEVIRRLGKGGYGLVLEARNKIDTCHYAIKIILLPSRAESKEKVLREVKALAKLDHRGIVRFYNSWLEVAPPSWEKVSLKDIDNTDFSSIFASLLSNNNSVVNNKAVGEHCDSVFSDCNPSKDLSIDDASLQLAKNEPTESDSYVVFENSSKKCDKDEIIEDVTQNNPKVLKEKSETTTNGRPNSLLMNSNRLCLFIQMQLCKKETLREWLRNNRVRDRKFMFELFVQIVNAVEYLHQMGLMHRDLKPSNIFFASDGIVKIGDFGLVTAASVDDFFHTPEVEVKENITPGGDEKHTNRVGTHLYMSPEQIRGVMYSNKVDIYSLGVIFFEMIVPFRTEMERVCVLNDVRQQKFPCDFKSKHSQECELLVKLLSSDPNERPSAEDILHNSLFKEIDEQFYLNERTTRRRTVSHSFEA